jgi:hypothetical protein
VTLDRLNAFNDQLCYFAFVEEEFERRLTWVNPQARILYTTKVFSENSWAPSIHVKIEDLSSFRDATKSAALAAFAAASYETVASYMKETLKLLGKTDLPHPVLVRRML